LCLQDQSRENPVEEDKQPIFQKMSTENKEDNNQAPLGDGKVESGLFNEGNTGGGPKANAEGDVTKVQPTTSSIK
jgi:hypothetical protein